MQPAEDVTDLRYARSGAEHAGPAHSVGEVDAAGDLHTAEGACLPINTPSVNRPLHRFIRILHTSTVQAASDLLQFGVVVMHPACASQAVREAAAAGRVGEVIRLVRCAHGLNQHQLGKVISRSQSTISRIERGGSGTRDVETLRRLGNELGIASVMLGLAEQLSPSRSSEHPMNRRELLLGAAAAAVFTSAVLPGTVLAEDESAAVVHAITTAQRRLDGTTPSSELAEPALAHLRMATRMQSQIWDPLSTKAMAAAVSEVAGLAGWLHWDMHDLGSARRYYRLAVEYSRRAEESLLTMYMLGSLASFVVHKGEASEGLALIRHAAKTSTEQSPATASAWLAAMEAVAHATSGDDVQTWRALDRAEAAVERIAMEQKPPWPWVFPFDARKIASHRLTCAVRLRRPDVAYTAVKNLSMVAAGHRKQGALVLLDLASAHVQTRELDQALRMATTAVDLAAQTQSERVLSRARQFRRTVPAHTPHRALREFDERLRTANTRDRAFE
jgi:transcriptional regulator with XRE-family HTH domain